LEVAFVLPSVFFDKDRIQTAEADEYGTFNSDTHEATAFQKVCGEVKEHEDDNGDVVGAPMVIDLPFQCETSFYIRDPTDEEDQGWNVDLFDNPDDVLKEEIEGNVDFFFLKVHLVSIVKPKQKKAKGKMRRITSPAGKETEESKRTNMEEDTDGL
jgi:hypothetical protein